MSHDRGCSCDRERREYRECFARNGEAMQEDADRPGMGQGEEQ